MEDGNTHRKMACLRGENDSLSQLASQIAHTASPENASIDALRILSSTSAWAEQNQHERDSYIMGQFLICLPNHEPRFLS